MFMVITVQVASDGLAVGMIQQVSCQLEIIKHRLHQLNYLKEKNYNIDTEYQSIVLKECMHHHSYIYL